MSADPFDAGVAWTSLVDADVAAILDAASDHDLDVRAVDAFLLAAGRRLDLGGDLRAHLYRIRTAYRARRVEFADLAAARAAAAADHLPFGGYAALPVPAWPDGDPWAGAVADPCI